MKKLTPKVHMTIANVLMGGGVVYNLIDMVVNGMDLRWVPTIVSVVLVAAGAVWRYTLVKCPYCGDKLKSFQTKLPDRCPTCNERLDKLPEE